MNAHYEKGLSLIRQMLGEQAAINMQAMATDAPQLSRIAIEAMGDLYGDETLDLKTRELLTVAALTALGTAPSQLRTHIRAALSTGWTREQIIAAITQMYAYGGMPAAHNGLAAAREVFRDIDQRTGQGL